jgi:hypothetical protein
MQSHRVLTIMMMMMEGIKRSKSENLVMIDELKIVRV